VDRLGIAPFVVDPVAASQHGDALLRPEAIDALRSLIVSRATIVTPNLGEIRLLTGVEVRGPGDMRPAARALLDLGATWALVKGGHMSGAESIDLLTDGNEEYEFSAPRTPTAHTHGSGDTLAAAITAGLARGLSVPSAVEQAKDFIAAAIRGSFPLGSGLGPVGHFWRVAPWP
jgi:hydroxymethylpyrimidine/phosphomethylpyrimidine kinase